MKFLAALVFACAATAGAQAPADPYFAKLLKVDFMWSIALKNVAP